VLITIVYLIKVGAAFAALWLVRPVRDLWRRVRRRHPVRVFTFHRVSDLCRDGMTVSPAVFAEQIAYIRQHHDVVRLERALELVRDGVRLRRPVAVITFDDGYRSVWERARPVLAQWGLPACCFVTTGLVGTRGRFRHDEANPVREHLAIMSWEELAQLTSIGWSVGGHSHTHRRLADLSGPDLKMELTTPVRMIRERLGLDAIAMAYPFGGPADFSAAARALTRACGYTACFSDYGGENFPGADAFALRRIDIGGDLDGLFWRTLVHGLDLGAWRARLARLV
jgi:peptidoglycan/xylan/chitin deacetylase (PgdA/CDA1 family)